MDQYHTDINCGDEILPTYFKRSASHLTRGRTEAIWGVRSSLTKSSAEADDAISPPSLAFHLQDVSLSKYDKNEGVTSFFKATKSVPDSFLGESKLVKSHMDSKPYIEVKGI